MFATRLRKCWAAGLAGALIAAGPGLAVASVAAPSFAPPNPVFADATQSFASLGTRPAAVDLTDPARPVFSNSPVGGRQLEAVWRFGPGPVLPVCWFRPLCRWMYPLGG